MSHIVARRVLTADGWVGPAVVEVENSRIVEIAPSSRPIDVEVLAPGFVDVQVNGIDDVDVATADAAGFARLGHLLLDQGVTAWCPTLITAPFQHYAEPLRVIAAAQIEATVLGLPTILGAHLEGPFLGGAPGAHPRRFITDAEVGFVDSLPSIVAMMTVAPESPGAATAIQALRRRGVTVALGHSRPSPEQVDDAIDAGASMVTHVFNAMSGVHHRDIGLANIALTDDTLFVGLIADLVHVHPRAVQITFRSKPDGKVVLVTDSVAWRAGAAGAVRLALVDGAPRLTNGTLAGSALRMDQAVRNVVEQCNVGLDVALRAASTNPAAALGQVDRGRIAPGARADLVALDDNLRISGVWLAGNRVR